MSGSMSDETLITLVVILSAPTALVLAVALLRGYSVKIWRHRPSREEDPK